MAEGDRQGGGFMDMRQFPSWERYRIGAQSIILAEDNPQETMLFSMTEQELALFAFANMVTAFLFPEFQNIVGRVNKKLLEVSDVQKFLEFEPGELDKFLKEQEGDSNA